MRDPENGIVSYRTRIRGGAEAPKSWNCDVAKLLARITFAREG
jgi:hypothetical protein